LRKKIAIFGANGFLGRQLTSYLKKEGYDVVTISRTGDVDIHLDVTDSSAWKQLTLTPEIVINCASILPGGDFWDEAYLRETFETNFWGSYYMAQWIRRTAEVQFVLNLSSLAVINKPWPEGVTEEENTYPFSVHQGYCISKLNQELVFATMSQDTSVKVCNARLSALFGATMKWSGVMAQFIDKALNNEPLEVVNGDKVSADFLYVEDACVMLERVIRNRVEGIINVASGKEIYLLDLATRIYEYVGSATHLVRNRTEENAEQNRTVIRIEKLKEYLENGFEPNIEKGLKETINYRKLNIIR